MKTLTLWGLLALLIGPIPALLAQEDLLPNATAGMPLLVIDRPIEDSIDLAPYVEVLIDTTGQMPLAEAQRSPDFMPYESVKDTFPLWLGERLWVRLRVDHQADFEQKIMFRTSETDSVVRYQYFGDSLAQARNGFRVRPAERDIPYGRPQGITFTLPPRDTAEIYLLMEEKVISGPYLVPELIDYQRWENLFYSEIAQSFTPFILFFGAASILILYNLIIFFSTRVVTYLYYALYLLVLLLSFLFDGLSKEFPTWALAFPDPRYNHLMSAIGICSISIFYLLFGRSLVETKTLTPRWDKALQVIIGLRLVFLVATILAVAFADAYEEMWQTMVSISLLMIVIEGLVLLVYMYWLIRSGSRVAWFFIVGSILVFGSGLSPILFKAVFDWDLPTDTLLLWSIFLEILVFSLGLGYKMRKQQREKLEAEQALNRELSKINTAFGRFVPHEFITSLGYDSVLDVKLGDQVEKEVTVLFSDIRGYTTLSEQMTPDENFKFLNAYLGRLGPVIQQHGGFVNQYYGDGIMALFLNRPSDALKAAVGMLRALSAYNQEREAKGRAPIRIGIGLHTGSLMMGIIGDTLRLEAGVVSDTVNTAARMEGLTKHFGVNLLLSEATWQRVREDREGREDRENREGREDGEGREAEEVGLDFGLRLLGNVLVKGRQQPLRVYECYDGDAPAQRDRKGAIAAEFEAGLSAYWQGDFERALRAWESVWHGLPGDGPTRHYVTLAQQYVQQGTPEDWDGVEVMLMK